MAAILLFGKLSFFEGFHECGKAVDAVRVLHLKRTAVDQEVIADRMFGLFLLRHAEVVELESLLPVQVLVL